MPRYDRIKDNNAIYYIMLRGLSESGLFKSDEDKDMYMSILKKIQDIYGFKVYAYLLLDNYGHLFIDSNGADISEFMKRINVSYSQRYNYKYKRCGHIFHDRFRSRIIESDGLLFNLIAYLHNLSFKEKVYNHSSLGTYIGLIKDDFKILDNDFIDNYFSMGGVLRERYSEYILSAEDEELRIIFEFEDQESKYISYKRSLIRELTSEEISDFVSKYTGQKGNVLHLAYIKEYVETRAIAAFLMRNFCDFKSSKMSNILGLKSPASVSSLVTRGRKLIDENEKYKKMVAEFLKEYKNEAK